jgi:hypothetical protein
MKVMEHSNLIPFVRDNLEILFIGLNPAVGSSRNGHYFSVNRSFWGQLHGSGLIVSRVDKSIADEIVFGGTRKNYQRWSYGITDLVPDIAESDSSKIKPTQQDCKTLCALIKKATPKVAVLLHGRVRESLLSFLGYPVPMANSGKLGFLLKDTPTMFFDIAFPHGNKIQSEDKIVHYRAIKRYLFEL